MPEIWFNPVAIEQVFLNLLSNAIEAQAHTIHIHTMTTAETVNCQVHDDGEGLNSAVSQALFDPFFTTRRHSGGTGLGLSLSYGIIQDHGGTLTVQSTPGTGTTFLLTLPLQPPQPLGGSS